MPLGDSDDDSSLGEGLLSSAGASIRQPKDVEDALQQRAERQKEFEVCCYPDPQLYGVTWVPCVAINHFMLAGVCRICSNSILNDSHSWTQCQMETRCTKRYSKMTKDHVVPDMCTLTTTIQLPRPLHCSTKTHMDPFECIMSLGTADRTI